MMFKNRVDAGRRLAARLGHLQGGDVVVVGLPRGGVPVAAEVARVPCAPLDVIVVRKLGVPFQPELGMGAIGEDGVRVTNDEVVRLSGVSDTEVAAVVARERVELALRALRFRAGRRRIPLAGRIVVIVDDGIATGSTAKAACEVARAEGAARVVLAVPVAPPDWTACLDGVADEFVCVETPSPFFGVGQFYADFTQTTDDEVVACLNGSAAPAAEVPESDPVVRDDEVAVWIGSVALGGHLTVPETANGIVVFAHGSGSSRHSPRNRYVGSTLNAAGLATLLFDLLKPREELERANVFDIELLTRRLVDVTRWLSAQHDTARLPVGYYGASTGAAAALWAAADLTQEITAVASRGGRPDLARPRLAEVTAPTLLIVGGDDEAVVTLNRQAQEQLRCVNRLAIVPGATHLFEEPGTLQIAAELARDWFVSNLVGAGTVLSPDRPGRWERAMPRS